MSRNIRAELPTTQPYSLFPHQARARHETDHPLAPSPVWAKSRHTGLVREQRVINMPRELPPTRSPVIPWEGGRVGWHPGRSQGCPIP